MRNDGLERATLEFVQGLAGVNFTESVIARFQSFVEDWGFSSVACLKIPEPGESLGTCMLMNTRPADWTQRYIEQGYVKHDLLVREMHLTYQPYVWSEVFARRHFGARERAIRDEAREFGIHEGLAVPVYETSGNSGLVSLAAGRIMVGESLRQAMTLASIVAHGKLCALRRRRIQDEVSLTQREVECLNWAAEGKTDAEIGVILSISQKTVNYHIENTKKKFGVATRVQAVVAAMRHGKLG